MNDKPTPGLFVTGTDTGVGKTHVAAMIVRALVAAGHKVGVYKPAASGCHPDGVVVNRLVSDDAVALWEASGRFGDLDRVCPQCFAAPLAPHLAARAEGRQLNAPLLRSGLHYWRERSDVVVVEGAGGLFSPLGDEELNIDLARELKLPLVVVAANRLGAIHAALATVIAARSHSPALPIAGVVLNQASAAIDESVAVNADELRLRLQPYGVPLLTSVAHGAPSLDDATDWRRLAGGAAT